jgi:hypothetical protein
LSSKGYFTITYPFYFKCLFQRIGLLLLGSILGRRQPVKAVWA